jgi:hypothetical protein
MKIVDTQPCNRAIVLEPNETLDSALMVSALTHGGIGVYKNKAMAEGIIGMLFDSLEAYSKKQARLKAANPVITT